MDIIGEKPPDTDSKPEICNTELEISTISTLQNNKTVERTNKISSKIEEFKDDLKQQNEKIQNIPSDNDMEIDFECSKVESEQNNVNIQGKTDENNIEILIEGNHSGNGKMEENESKQNDLIHVIEIESDQNDSNNKSKIDSESKSGESNENEFQIDKTHVKEIFTIDSENGPINIEKIESNIPNIDESQSNIINIDENHSIIVNIDENESNIINIDENESNIVNLDEHESNIVNLDENESNIVNIDKNESNIVNIDENDINILNINKNENNIENIDENECNIINIDENESNFVTMEENDSNIVNIQNESSSSNDVQIINNEESIKSPDDIDSPKSETRAINDSISSKQKSNSQNLVDSIASEWNLSDGEGDTDPPPKSGSSPVPLSSPKTTEKSSAEIIAMEWDDGSAPPNENINTENKIIEEIVDNTVEKKSDIPEENNHSGVDDSTNSIICTVIENTEENTEKNDNHENVIILHDLSSLNLNNQNSGITIISVDENPDMNSSSNPTNENSYVIHELNIEPPPSNLTHSTNNDSTSNRTTSTPKIVEKRRSNRTTKYPYVVCSKEDLCKEIEQARKISTDLPPGGDVLFKNQIIKRLASKILPKSLNNSQAILNNVDIKPPVFDKPVTPTNSNNTVTTDQELLDILEGDTDIDVYNLQKAKESHLAGDDSKILKSDEILSTSLTAGSTSRSRPKKLDPDLEREIALQQLSEMPDLPTPSKRKGKNNNVVLTNVPSTIIIEKTEKSVEGADPFKFVENTKTVGTPSKFGAAATSVKTYSRKGPPVTEPSLKDIVIPKELEQHINFDKYTPSKRRKYNRKSTTETPKQAKTTNKKPKKGESVNKKNVKDKEENNEGEENDKEDKNDKEDNNDNNDKEDKRIDNKIFLTDDTSSVLISKRSRIIKRKIIWDPSLKAPTYVLPSVAKGKVQKTKNVKHLIPNKKLKSIGNAIVKDEFPKDGSDKKENIQENNVISDDINDKIENKKDVSEENSSINANITPNKRKVESITSSTSSGGTPSQTRKKKFKYMSEIDKLLMDEGAVNMMYSVEQDEKTPLVRRQQRVISLDKFDKEIAKKKKMILTALNTSPETTSKALRKKESSATPPVRKKSRDSIRSSIQSPPPSPNSMFPPRAEASRIIRRHSSSSSFSSECMSPRRLSVVDTPTLPTANEKIKKNTTSDDVSKSTAQKQIKKENSIVSTKKATQPTKKMRIMKLVQPRNLRRRGGVPIFVKKNKTNSYPSDTKSKYIIKKIENKIDGNTDENRECEQKQEKNSTETENNVVLRSIVQQKTSKKESPIKSSSPTPDSYQNIVKSLDNSEILKKKDGTGGDVEKQRTSSRQNAGTYNYKEISVRKYDELVQIIFTPQSSTKMKNSLNIQTMREFCDALATLKKDSSCKVLLITSTGSVFCRGLDYTPLIQQNMEKRKTIAQETANAIKEFVRAIVQFPRPVIAGVQGAASGLGVAILPLCDLVFVSDKATFSMNQCKLGCLPEGAASVSLPHVTSHAVAAELLIAGHTLTAMEALRHGLASRVLWPEGYFQELIPLCKAIASQSSQSMDTTKLLIRHSLSLKLEAALDSESHILVQHWVSSECQQLLKKFVEQQD